MPMVTAGLRCASALPHAIAVKTPVITAKAHPAVIASHPEPSALLRLSSMLATLPLPIRMRIIVPMNSPKYLDAIGPRELAVCDAACGLQPVEGPRDGLLPESI